MNIQTYSINDSKVKYLEVIEPLNASDFTVKINKPAYDTFDKEVRGSLELVPTQETVEKLIETLDVKVRSQNDGETDENYQKSRAVLAIRAVYGDYIGHVSQGFREKLDFRGCRKQDTKDAKINQGIMTIASKLLMEQDTIVHELLNKLNSQLASRIEYKNRDYTDYMKGLYSGERIKTEWVEEHLDDPKVAKQIKGVQEEMKELQEQLSGLRSVQQEKRNKTMYLYLTGNSWGGDEDLGHDPIPGFLRDELTEMYQNNEGFAPSTRRGAPVFN